MPKPRLTVQVEAEDKAALDAVTARVRESMPALGDQSQSLVHRAALRLGLLALARDPSLVTTTPPPVIEDEPSGKRRKHAAP